MDPFGRSDSVPFAPRKRKPGRPRIPISPGYVAKLKNSPDRYTWKEITRQVNSTTAMAVTEVTVRRAYQRWIKEWKGVVPKSHPETVLGHNLIDGMKKCLQCSREDGLSVYKPFSEFSPVKRMQHGMYLKQNCKECEVKRHAKPAAENVVEADDTVPKVTKLRAKAGRPAKVTGMIAWLGAADGETLQQTAKRLRLKPNDVRKALARGVEPPVGVPGKDWHRAVEAMLQRWYSVGLDGMGILLTEQHSSCAACGDSIGGVESARLDEDRGKVVCVECAKVIRQARRPEADKTKMERRLGYLRSS